MRLPLFPLNTVLFPGGIVQLRIFEARYLDMIRACLREQGSFGVIMIRSGEEVGAAASTYQVGTTARVADWDMRPGGLLHVQVSGGDRFALLQSEVQSNQLQIGTIELWPAEPAPALPPHYTYMAQMLMEVLPRVSPLYTGAAMALDNASWVSARFTEILPLPAALKQNLLEMSDAQARLEELDRQFHALRD